MSGNPGDSQPAARQSASLLSNPTVRRSISRLKKMGLKVYVEEKTPDSVLIVVDSDSIVEAVRRQVSSAFTYPHRVIAVDKENRALLIGVWRGEVPSWVLKLKAGI